VERASGNPFFVEEIVRVLADAGVVEGARGSYRLMEPLSTIEVPPTVQAVLAARIDALPAAEKRLLQEAAAIGQDVSFTLLQAICELTEDELRGQLDSLQAAEFLYATQLFPDLQYALSTPSPTTSPTAGCSRSVAATSTRASWMPSKNSTRTG
jgi:predicted ATPase